MRTNLTIIAAVAIITFLVLSFAGQWHSDDQTTPMPQLAQPMQGPVAGPGSWFRDNEGILDQWFDRRVARMLEEAHDPAKMRVAKAQHDRGQKVESVGVLFGLALTAIVKQIITLVIVSILTAIVVSYFKAHIFKAVCIVVAFVATIVLISWLTSRNVAYGVLEKRSV